MITTRPLETSLQVPCTDGIANARAAIKAGGIPTGALRAGLRALACEPRPKAGLHRVKRLRPLVREMQEILAERLLSGGPVLDYLQGRARLADSALVGLLHIASVATRMRGNSMVAPLAAVAVGGYGRNELAPGSDLDVLFLLPESSGQLAKGGTNATIAYIEAVVAGLWDLGFTLDHAARSSQECLDLARSEPTVLAGLLDRRFLWGGYGLFAALNTGVAELFSGPDAAHWSGAVGEALASAHRCASCGTQTAADEPDVKRDPGGLRDLQRALFAAPLHSCRVTALTAPVLIEAHRFLWLVRCHLHLLAGRAQDRLTVSLQPEVARRLGLEQSEAATAAPRLLDLFRCHTHNVLQAVTLSTASVAVSR